MPPASHTRRYSAFISYRHADNTQEGRRWAEWLHRALERYTVPPDLIGTPNLRGEPIRDSLYPIFRDEDELPANADLATGIRAALEVSDHLIVLCSPRSAVSPWVRKEVREFKELGRSDRILAIIIAGEPNADDPAKAREGILRDEECFCEELRFGAPVVAGVCDPGSPIPASGVTDPGYIDWTIRTEPLAADLRPNGTRAEGFVTAEAYREHLTLNSSLTPDKIATRTEAYRQQLDHALIKVIAGLLGVPLGQLKDRDAAQRTAVAEAEAAKQREIAERERQLAEQAQRSANEAHRAKLATERIARHLAIAGTGAFALALLTGWFWWQSGNERNEADRQRAAAQTQAEKARTALSEANRQLERSQFVEGRSWLERGRVALDRRDHLSALMLFGRAFGFAGLGRLDEETQAFEDAYPPLLHKLTKDPLVKADPLVKGAGGAASETIYSINSVGLPLPIWAGIHKDVSGGVAFSPDGSRLASGSDNKIKLWDVSTGSQLLSLEGHTNVVGSIAFSPDGSRLASGSLDETIKLWDVATGRELGSLKGQLGPVISIAFSPDGSRLAICSLDKKTIKLWDVATGKELASLQGHTNVVVSIAFSPDGSRLASGSLDKTIKLWDAASGKELASLKEHTDAVASVAFSPDGSRLASGSFDKTIKLWDAATTRELASLFVSTRLGLFGDIPDKVSSVAFSPDGSRIVSGSVGGTIKLLDGITGKELGSLMGHTDRVIGVAFSPDGSRLASSAEDKTIKLWDASMERGLVSLRGHTGAVLSVAFSSDGCRLASGAQDKTIKLWDADTGKEFASLQGHTDPVLKVVFSPDGSRLASSSDAQNIKLWDAATGNELTSPTTNDFTSARQWLAVEEDRLHPDGQRIAVCDNHMIFIVPSDRRLDLTAPLRAGLAAFKGNEFVFPAITATNPMIHYRQDTLAQLANPKLTPERRAELRMELCTKSSQFRAATALWQRLLKGEWPGFEGATVPKDQAPATIPADSPIRRLYLLALIDATKHPQIHGHPTICQTTAQIAPVLTKEMMATPTISLAMMSLMQILAKDESAEMNEPRAALMKKLDEVATMDWLAVLRGK